MGLTTEVKQQVDASEDPPPIGLKFVAGRRRYPEYSKGGTSVAKLIKAQALNCVSLAMKVAS